VDGRFCDDNGGSAYDCNQSGGLQLAYFWNGNAGVDGGTLMSNTAYNLTSNDFEPRVLGGATTSFYLVPVSLFSVPTSCTTIPT
jgi:hypothetical protein